MLFSHVNCKLQVPCRSIGCCLKSLVNDKVKEFMAYFGEKKIIPRLFHKVQE